MEHFLRGLSGVGAYLVAILITPCVCLMALMFRLGVLGTPLSPDSPQGIAYSDLIIGYQLLLKGKWPPLWRTHIDGGE